MCYWEENINGQIEISYILKVLLTIPFIKLPWFGGWTWPHSSNFRSERLDCSEGKWNIILGAIIRIASLELSNLISRFHWPVCSKDIFRYGQNTRFYPLPLREDLIILIILNQLRDKLLVILRTWLTPRWTIFRVINLRSDTFSNPIFQKVLQN